MASRFRKEFVDVYVKTYVKNAELRVEKVPGARVPHRFCAQERSLFSKPNSLYRLDMHTGDIAVLSSLDAQNPCTMGFTPIENSKE